VTATTSTTSASVTPTGFTARGGSILPTFADAPVIPPRTPATRERGGSAVLRWLRALTRSAASLTMLVLVAAFTVVAALPAVDARAMIVLSGSMEPLLSAGDAAIIREVESDDLVVGDVITFQGIGADKRLTTHRIIDLVPLDSGLHFQTQGDANSSPDVDLAPAANVVGRYDGRIPYGGRALLLLSRPEAKIVLVALPAALILIGELRTMAGVLAARRRERAGPAGRRLAFTAAMLVLSAIAGVAATAATMAVVTDTAAAGDNSFSTATTFS
jgi:signal peptidase